MAVLANNHRMSTFLINIQDANANDNTLMGCIPMTQHSVWTKKTAIKQIKTSLQKHFFLIYFITRTSGDPHVI